ncbi:hypothetical protein SK803_00595 [Lentzea sp. BCCO 10_0856]|uniref:Uncharacterized protein n=1 Tax=Lentzea miocenica TaxID=3095431 RepID=A0ABU4SRZ6_9PSEU|nr:hypothetical protein [Lentzea sp. BCCO 10_0856]MDX8028681.1 hypothetical protein [Lentzea sp. BCCO 10_0856]
MVEPYEKLATALSVAVRIEPELIRAVRLAVFPKFDVSAEADLWFSPLVRSRGPHGIVFDEDAVVGLRAKLTSWLRSTPDSDPVHRVGEVLSSVHKRLSPALALEERVTWLAVNGRDEAIDEELLPALKALVRENRSGVADWFTAAWHRLPANARESLTAWKLAQVVRPDLNGTAPPLTLLRAPESGPDLSDIVDVLPDARLLLRRNGNTLEIGDFTPDADTVGIMVPDTDPRLLDVGANPTVAVRRGASTSVAVPAGTVRVRTARGTVFELATGSSVAGQFVAVEVVPGVKSMTLMDGFEALDGVLGDDYTLTTLLGDTEREVARYLEVWLRENQRNDAPLVVYLKEWDHGVPIDEILRVCVSSGSTQILVMVDPAPQRLNVFEDVPNVWMALVSTGTTDEESPPSKLATLLTSGPSAAAARRRWSAGDQHITVRDVNDEFSSLILMQGNETPGPMFRNPLHGRADDTLRWLDNSAEVDSVVRWVRDGEPGVFVIAGSAGTGKSAILDGVAQQVSVVRLSTLEELNDVLDTELVPPVVVVDGLDSEDTEWVSAIGWLFSGGGRAVVTMRPTAPLLRELAEPGAYIDLDDLRAHVIRRLTDVHPDMNADAMAWHLIETLELPPLLTRRVTHELANDPVPTRPRGFWADQVLSRLHSALEDDIRGERLLFMVLAWSHGSGMPIEEWRACATEVGDYPPDYLAGTFVSRLVSRFSAYVASNVRGHRLSHPELVAYLRKQSAPELPRQIALALATMVLRYGDSSPYLRGSLRHHVIDGGADALAYFREIARQDPSWLRELGAAAATLATTTTGDQRVECAETAVQAYTQLVANERRYRRELSSALDQLTSSLRAVGERKRADQVWPDAMRRLPDDLARWVQDTRIQAPTTAPSRRPMRSYDMVVVVPGVTHNVLRTSGGAPVAFASLPLDIGDDHPGDGVVAGELDLVGYARLLDGLHAHGYTRSKGNLLLLPYDWRLSHRWTGRWIGEQVEVALAGWREKSDPDAQVVFVCVSTGGLPARWYVERCGGAEITAGMIMIGTPYRGTMRDLEQLVNGADDPVVTDFWRSLPSMYQTLPIYNCVDDRGSRVPLNEVTVPVLDRHRVEDGMAFLTDLLSAESSRPHALDNTHCIIGTGHATPVTARIVRRNLRVSDQLGDNHWQGDSYVPTFSACHPDTATSRAIQVEASHNRLHRNDEVLRELTRILPRAAPVRKL